MKSFLNCLSFLKSTPNQLFHPPPMSTDCASIPLSRETNGRGSVSAWLMGVIHFVIIIIIVVIIIIIIINIIIILLLPYLCRDKR